MTNIPKLKAFLEGESNKLSLVNFGLDEIKELDSLAGQKKTAMKELAEAKAHIEASKNELAEANKALALADNTKKTVLSSAKDEAVKIEAEAKAAADKILADANAQAETIKRDAESLKAEQKAALALKVETDRVRKELEAEQGKLDKIKADLLKIMNVGGN
jgi:chemotaxis protein MotB